MSTGTVLALSAFGFWVVGTALLLRFFHWNSLRRRS